jgi:hypothetical protein
MMILQKNAKINDLILHVEEKKRRYEIFDPDLDMSQEEWATLRKFVQDWANSANTFGVLELGSNLKLLAPEHFKKISFGSEIIEESTDKLDRKTGSIDPVMLEMFAQFHIVFPHLAQRYENSDRWLNLKLNSLMRDIELGIERESLDDFHQALLMLRRCKINFPNRLNDEVAMQKNKIVKRSVSLLSMWVEEKKVDLLYRGSSKFLSSIPRGIARTFLQPRHYAGRKRKDFIARQKD